MEVDASGSTNDEVVRIQVMKLTEDDKKNYMSKESDHVVRLKIIKELVLMFQARVQMLQEMTIGTELPIIADFC